MNDPVYEVFALKYAQREGRRPAHFVGGDPHDVPMPMDYFIWLVRNPERTVLVDTGFDAAMAGKRNRTLLRTPAAALALLGVQAADLRDVVITHLHNDHVGTFYDFPAATFHLQDDEMEFVSGRWMRHDYEHFEQRRVYSLVYHLGEALEGYDKLRRLAASLRHIIPGHDPLVMRRYPAVSSELAGIAVRLDVDPVE
jgi:metallo-beta-lactamase superfamily protein